MNKFLNNTKTLIFLYMILFSLNAFPSSELTINLTQNAKLFIKNLKDGNSNFKLIDLNYQETDLYDNSYLPINLDIRKNAIILEELDIEQTRILHNIFSELLSSKGYFKLMLNLLIDKQYQSSGFSKNTNHIIKFYGDPNTDWGLKIEGYHLSLSFFINKGELKFVNFFIGQDTDLFKTTEYNISQLYNYADFGYDLMNSLTPKQMQKAYLGMSIPTDIMNKPNHYKSHLKQRSLNTNKLKKQQIILFTKWLNEYLDLINPNFTKNLTDKLEKSKHEEVNFSWSGGLNKEKNIYFFIFNEFIFIDFIARSNHLHNIVRLNFD